MFNTVSYLWHLSNAELTHLSNHHLPQDRYWMIYQPLKVTCQYTTTILCDKTWIKGCHPSTSTPTIPPGLISSSSKPGLASAQTYLTSSTLSPSSISIHTKSILSSLQMFGWAIPLLDWSYLCQRGDCWPPSEPLGEHQILYIPTVHPLRAQVTRTHVCPTPYLYLVHHNYPPDFHLHSHHPRFLISSLPWKILQRPIQNSYPPISASSTSSLSLAHWNFPPSLPRPKSSTMPHLPLSPSPIKRMLSRLKT